MIDTLTFLETYELKLWNAPDWKISVTKSADKSDVQTDPSTGRTKERWKLQARYKGDIVRAWGYVENEGKKHLKLKGAWLTRFEVSLPRLAFGTNGRLISSPTKLRHALKVLERAIRQVAKPFSDGKYRRDYKRVDLVWQFSIPPLRFFEAFEDFRYPGIRKATAHYHDESITWPGDGLRIVAYDKCKEMKLSKGGVLRVEAQLSGRPLKKWLGDKKFDAIVHELSFRRCYEAYRRILAPFMKPPRSTPSTLHAKLAALDSLGIQVHGQPISEWWMRGESVRTKRRVAEAKRKHFLDAPSFDLRQLLPQHRLPKVVEIARRASG